MPYGMPSIMMQGPVLEALGKMLNKNFGNTARYKNYLKSIKSDLNRAGSRVPDLMVQRGVIAPNSASDQHLRTHWFPDPNLALPTTAWWPGLQPLEPIVKAGYVYAIDENLHLFSQHKKPLRFDSYWVCIEDWDDTDPEYFQVAHTVTDSQITIIIFTPPEPKPSVPPPSMRVAERVFFTKRQGPERPGLEQVDLTTSGAETIGLYQVHRLYNLANASPAAERRGRARR